MNLNKLVEVNKIIEEIKTIISEKTRDFHLNANTHQLIYLEDSENFEAHCTMDFIRLSISHGVSYNNKNRAILISFESVNLFLSGLKKIAEDFDGKDNFLEYVTDF